MKRFYPLIGLVCIMCVAAAVVLLVGSRSMQVPDADARYTQANQLLRHLRNGETLDLADAFPLQWDTAQFASSMDDLSRLEQDELFRHDTGFPDRYADEELLVLWMKDQMVATMLLPVSIDGYPRFRDVLGNGSFSVSRPYAKFLCTFIKGEDSHGGYFDCSIEGKPL